MLDLRRLRYFVTVSEARSFRGAADELHVAQSAVSRQVATLEASLGVRLLVRSSRSVQLTAAGKILLPRAQALLRDAAGLQAEAEALGAGRRGVVRLGYSTSLGYETAPILIQAVERALPDADVEAVLLATPKLTGALGVGDIDLSLVRCPPIMAGLTASIVRRERLGLVVRAAHPLATSGYVDPLDIRDENLRLHEREANPTHYDVIVSACQAAGFEPRIVGTSAPFDPAFGAVAAGRAVAIVSESAASGLPPALVYVPLQTATTVPIALLARTDESRPLVLAARDAILAAATAVWMPDRDRVVPA